MAKPPKSDLGEQTAAAMRQAMRETDERPAETAPAAAAAAEAGQPHPAAGRAIDVEKALEGFETPHAPKKPLTVSDEPAIEINSMNKWYGDFHVLKDINLTIFKGERIVVCGPSGSGKSTLIRCINRLEQHQSGHIVV